MEARLSWFAIIALIVLSSWNLLMPLATQPSKEEVLDHEEYLQDSVETYVEPELEPEVIDPEPVVESDPECVDGECPPKVYYQRRGLFRWQKVVK